MKFNPFNDTILSAIAEKYNYTASQNPNVIFIFVPIGGVVKLTYQSQLYIMEIDIGLGNIKLFNMEINDTESDEHIAEAIINFIEQKTRLILI